jgi:hypothetical protein
MPCNLLHRRGCLSTSQVRWRTRQLVPFCYLFMRKTSTMYTFAISAANSLNELAGGNEHGWKIEMTAPVRVLLFPGAGPFCRDMFTVSFFLPFDYQVTWISDAVPSKHGPGVLRLARRYPVIQLIGAIVITRRLEASSHLRPTVTACSCRPRLLLPTTCTATQGSAPRPRSWNM